MGYSDAYRRSFIEWTISKGVVLDEFVSFKPSKLGGTGVFFDLDGYTLKKGKISGEEDIEVLRVPKSLSLSLDTIVHNLLIPQSKHDADAPDNYIKQSQVLTRFLTLFNQKFNAEDDPYVRGGLNETNILVGEIQILSALKIIRDNLINLGSIDDDYKNFLRDSPFSKFDEYLELLQLTEVSSLKLDQYVADYEEIFKYFQRDHRIQTEQIKNQAIWESLDLIDDVVGLDFKELFNLSFLRKVESSVISRILEIPEAIEEHGDPNTPATTDPADDKENIEYGFSVASSLVPIIDFVNHSVSRVNSAFDSDKETKDIVLRVSVERIKDLTGEIELFISYDVIEDVLKFAHAYGFIPNTSSPVLYDCPIDREFILNYDIKDAGYSLGKILKWLDLPANVQFVTSFDSYGKIDDLRLNLDMNLIVYGFSKGLKYDGERAFVLFKCLCDENDIELSDGSVKEWLELYESSLCDVVEHFGCGPFYAKDDEDKEMLSVRDLVEAATDEEANELIVKFLDFLVDYFKYRLEILNGFIERVEKDQTRGFSLVLQLAKFERELGEQFLKQMAEEEDKLDLILDVDDIVEKWSTYRLTPRRLPESALWRLVERDRARVSDGPDSKEQQ